MKLAKLLGQAVTRGTGPTNVKKAINVEKKDAATVTRDRRAKKR